MSTPAFDVLDAIGHGGGGAAAVRALHRGQVHKNLILVGHLIRRWPGPARVRDNITDILDRACAHDRDSFDRVLTAPLTAAWAGAVVRADRSGRAAAVDFEHLNAFAVVAAAACGVAGEAEVPVRDGRVAIPGIGLAAASGASSTRLSTDGRRLALDDREIPTGAPSQWIPVRRIDVTAGARRLDVSLDDIDPYRHGYHAPPAPRLTDAEADGWTCMIEDAWRLLVDHLPDRADELAEGLRTIVPLLADDPGVAKSATNRHAFGMFGATRPVSPAEFAVTAVHEFQHSKLSALLDLDQLTDPADQRRYFAPWRTDPRPLPALLQGVYAFAGVADAWRGLCADGPEGSLAALRFAETRLQLDAGLQALDETTGLTAQGQRLAGALRETADRLLAAPLGPAETRRARDGLADTRREWAARNSGVSA